MLEEIDKLIELAEKSTKVIDHSTEQKSEIKRRFFNTMAALYVIVFTGLAGFFFLGDTLNLNSRFASVVFFASLGVFVFFTVTTYFNNLKKINRTLKIEYAVQQRLISLIDEQLNSAQARGEMSPVAHATFEMRTRRLEREL
jgi:ABC-type multidrug transport system fused ATPase/permease subunit